ncbi:hypothetical protein BO71DRAFT_359366 [Aspergillus ellipticus CBS 707.79]|uniref:PPP4R2-domain-containing protein n=1 Tax=Aspergillus ellipticus CBS 707.79 TaxID=1448320 RepID=A0A319DJT2_9EURO|nr:hypothetical protein BO71DRAFT_359366 [Aspergillus ellipticus CBS 707.79]
MSLDEESLEVVANGGSMDFEKWPSMVEPLLERLEHIVYNVFAMPQVPPGSPSHQQPPSTTTTSNPLTNDKDTTPPPPATTTSSDPTSAGEPSPPLPEPLHLLLTTIKTTLRSLFSTKPPHTIQRLAELILRPTAHYHTLPAYLRAMDRVICVTSSADIFPLQTARAPTHPNGAIVNGAEPAFMFPDHTPGSDESLGGALLTPIPWLSNVASSPEGEGGAVVSDTVFPVQAADGAGGLSAHAHAHAHEQTGLVHPATGDAVIANGSEGAAGSSPPPADAEDIPHARGPSVVGVEDLGLQDGKGVEMDLSNAESEAKSAADGDGDISLEDAKAEEGSGSAEKDPQQV